MRFCPGFFLTDQSHDLTGETGDLPAAPPKAGANEAQDQDEEDDADCLTRPHETAQGSGPEQKRAAVRPGHGLTIAS